MGAPANGPIVSVTDGIVTRGYDVGNAASAGVTGVTGSPFTNIAGSPFISVGGSGSATGSGLSLSFATIPCCDSCSRGEKCDSVRDTLEIAEAIVSAFAGKAKEVEIDGRTFLKFPIAMMVEGVRQAANAPAPELLLRKYFKKALKKKKAKKAITLTYTHPSRTTTKGKQYVGAADKHDDGTGVAVGTVSDIHFVGKKMIGTAMMDVAAMEAAGDGAKEQLKKIRSNKMVQVSLGHRAKIYPLFGRWNGKAFFGVHVDPELDHLAIMEPGMPGACSIKDGCGAPRASAAFAGADREYIVRALARVKAEKSAGFVVQSLIFKKTNGWTSAKARTWAHAHGFRSEKVDETVTSFRLRQRDPGRFSKIRTICLAKSPTGGGCRVTAVGGPLA